MEYKNKMKSKYIHIAIIVLGIIFVSIPIFHENIWFDESYTVGISSKSFIDIWKIGSNDVHPVLYYFILHIFYLIFGSNIYIYRFLSMIPIAILGILGYTHIKKDFGEKIGFLFSFLTLFLPISSIYSGEIRMYSWAMLIVSLMAIYAYYGLAVAGVINSILFVYLLINSIKAHRIDKKTKIYNTDLKCFTISAIMQILLYIPWFLVAVIKQIEGMSNGFWIPKPSIEIFMQIFIFQFTGDLDLLYIGKFVAIIFGIMVSAYAIYSTIRAVKINKNEKNKTSNLAGFWAVGIYFIVMLCILIISIKKPILFARYFLNLTGLFIFFLAFFIAKGGRKLLTTIFCIIVILMSATINYKVIQTNYDETNSKPLNYVKQDVKKEDLILFDNRGSGFVISMQLIDIPNCFYDKEQWNVEAAYEAFGKEMMTVKTLEPLDNYKGRIWLVTSDNYYLYDEFVERYGKQKITLIKEELFETKYHGYRYAISLIEKK